MAVTVKKATLWRRELANRPGTLAETLRPLAEAGVNLQVVMGYVFPGESNHAAVEVYPISGAKAEKAAREAGLAPAKDIACLLVSGDDRAGIGAKISEGLAGAGINISFVIVQVTGKKYLSIYGFESDAAAEKAMPIIKRASMTVAGKKTGARKAAKRGGAKKTAAKKTTKKAAGKKATGGKKTTRKKTAAKKSTAKKSTAKKPAGKKVARKKPAAKKKPATKKKTASRKK